MARANKVPLALRETPKALTAGQKAFQSFSRTFGPRATQGLVSTVETLEKIGPVASKIGPPLATAAMAAGAVGIALAGGAAIAAKNFGEAVVDAQTYREDITEALKVVRKTDEAATSTLETALRSADRFGVKRAESIGQFLDLATKGFDDAKIDEIVGRLRDLTTIDPRASMEGLTKVIGKVQATGRLNQETLNELSTFGLEQADVIKQIGKRMGKNDAEVLKSLSSTGGIRGLGVDPILDAIAAQTGGKAAGAAAQAKADRNLSSLIQRMKDIPSNLLFDAQVGPGIDGVKDTIRTIVDFFDVSKGRGKEVRQVVGDTFNALIEGLTGNKVDTKKGIQGTLDAILDGAKSAVPVVKELATGARDMLSLAAAMGRAAGTVRDLAEPFGGLGKVWKTLTFPLRTLAATILGPLAILPELYGGFKSLSTAFDGASIGGAFSSLWQQLKTAGASIINEGMNLGANLWQGLVNGITGGIGAVVGAATGLANAALGAVGSSWRVASPSKAFEELSLWAGAGASRGFRKSTADVAGSAGAMASTALGAAWAAGQANTNGGAGIVPMTGGPAGGVVINFSPTIVVSGASSPAQAQAAGAAAVRGSREAFEAQLGSAMRRVRFG